MSQVWAQPKLRFRLGIHPVWSESLLCVQWASKDPRIHHAKVNDSVQTRLIPMLVWVFLWRMESHIVGLLAGHLCFDKSGGSRGGFRGFARIPLPAPRFLNILWKWNNLVSVRPNYFIFFGYDKIRRFAKTPPSTHFFNIQQKWNNLVSLRPNYFISWIFKKNELKSAIESEPPF